MGRGKNLFVGALLLLSSVDARADDKANGSANPTKVVTATTAGSMGSMQSASSNELAAVAYDRGAAAFDAKDYVRAAEEFSRADMLAPNPLALQLALDSAMRSGRAAMVMELATRAEARLASGANLGDRANALNGLVARAHAEYEARTGTLTVLCPPPRVCTARLDDRAFAVNTRGWAAVGRHVLRVKIDGREEHRDVVIPSREQIEVRPEVPPSGPVARTEKPPSGSLDGGKANAADPKLQGGNPPPPKQGLSPAWFWVGATTTAVLGGLAIASGVDTYAKHNEFELNRTPDRASDGREAQTRTNVLLGLTAIGAVATATLAVFFVEWPHKRTPGRASTSRTTLGLGSCLTLTTTY